MSRTGGSARSFTRTRLCVNDCKMLRDETSYLDSCGFVVHIFLCGAWRLAYPRISSLIVNRWILNNTPINNDSLILDALQLSGFDLVQPVLRFLYLLHIAWRVAWLLCHRWCQGYKSSLQAYHYHVSWLEWAICVIRIYQRIFENIRSDCSSSTCKVLTYIYRYILANVTWRGSMCK